MPNALHAECSEALSNKLHPLNGLYEGDWWRTSVYKPGQIAIGSYAAQLAWWLRFFPAERFLVVPSAATHDAANATRVCQHLFFSTLRLQQQALQRLICGDLGSCEALCHAIMSCVV